MSLIEVGPAEVEPAAAAPVDAPSPLAARVKPDGRAAVEAGNRLQQRRQDQSCRVAIWAAIRRAMDQCRAPQLARNPRLQGHIRVEVTVQAQPGQAYGLLSEAGVHAPDMYMPLFDGCIRSYIAAVSLPNPASQVQVGYAFTLAHEVRSTEPEDDDGAESSEDDEDAADADD